MAASATCCSHLDWTQLLLLFHQYLIIMPRTRSKRRKRSSSKGSDNEGEVAPDSPATLPGGPLSFHEFLAAPEELRARILDLAFHLPLSSAESPDSPKTNPIAPIDIPTTLSLALTSRWSHQRAMSCLYRDIKINRPSTLTTLQQTFALRPQLGRLVKSLYVGPANESPEPPAPVIWELAHHDANGAHHPTVALFAASLLPEAEAAKLFPRWWQAGERWSKETSDDHDAKTAAIAAALSAISESLGNPFSYDNAPPWCQVLALEYEAQTALDLYLIEMRRIEDLHEGSGTHGSQPPDYPQLVLIGTPTQPTLPEGIDRSKCFVLTRQELLQRLSRPGCPTDSFDHPLLLARSGFLPQGEDSTGTTLRSERSVGLMYEPEDIADSFSTEGVQGRKSLPGSLDLLDPASLNAPTAGSILATLRCLLSLTPGLENLALTGFLERAVCGSRSSGPLLKTLQSLSLGPPPAVQNWCMPMALRALRRVAKLRICGINLRGDEADEANTYYRDFQWTMPDDLNGKDLLRWVCGRHASCGSRHAMLTFLPTLVASIRLGVIIDLLAGRKGVAADAALRELGFEELTKPRLPFTYSAAKEDASEDEDARLDKLKGRVEIRPRPAVFKAMLDRAASDAERADWAKGRPRPQQQQRLLLNEFPRAAAEEAGDVADRKALRQAMYDEGKEWWAKYCKAEERKHAFERDRYYKGARKEVK